MTIEINKESQTRAIQSIQRYFDENMEESIGNITANALLHFFLTEIGPSVYNQAVLDTQKKLLSAVEEVDIEVHKDEFEYWARNKR